jgi:hypothetical protein
MWRNDDIVNSSIGGIGRVTDVIGPYFCVLFTSGRSMYHTADELQPAMCIVKHGGHEYVCRVLEIYTDSYDVLWNGQVWEVAELDRVGKWNEFAPDMAYADYVRISMLDTELA